MAKKILSTGVDDQGNPLAGGAPDPHWRIVLGPPGFHAKRAVVLSNPPNTYFASNGSRWIWLDSAGTAGETSVPYVFRLEFELSRSGYCATVLNVSEWGVDNNGSVLLNGQPTGKSLGGNAQTNFTSPSSFKLKSGFLPGRNTLDFVVVNSGGPAGLNVHFSATEKLRDDIPTVHRVLRGGTAAFAMKRVEKPNEGCAHSDVTIPLPANFELNSPATAAITVEVVNLDDAEQPRLPTSSWGPLECPSPVYRFMTQVLGLYQNSPGCPWNVMVRVWGHDHALPSDDRSVESRDRAAWPPNSGVVVVVDSGGGRDDKCDIA
ncbi:hypothetical protein [Aquisphaera insulae]|uniref:hypothetical protein n=1 Tax=Aquisphaera insulae TaxID=2712864 RepID=UPI0013ECBE7E|nr:hypothetical protein [Aquisphaera insulae]